MFWSSFTWPFRHPKRAARMLKVFLPAAAIGLSITLVNLISIFVISYYFDESKIDAAVASFFLVLLVEFTISAFVQGVGVYYAQFLRRNERDKIFELMRYGLAISFLVAAIFIAGFFTIGTQKLVSLVLLHSSRAAIFSGGQYLGLMMITFAFRPFNFLIYEILTINARTMFLLIIRTLTSIINIVLAIIFCSPHILHWGFNGAAFATDVAVGIETVIWIGYLTIKHPYWWPPMIFGHISRKTISLSFISGCFFLPSNLGYPIFLLLQESFASRFGGINPTAAVSVGSVLMDAFFALLIGMYAVVPKYVSSYLGIGESTKAEQNANRVFWVAFFFFFAFNILLTSGVFWLPVVYRNSLSQPQAEILRFFLLGNGCCYLFFIAGNQLSIIVKAGGVFVKPVLLEFSVSFLLFLPLEALFLKFKVLPPKWLFFTLPWIYFPYLVGSWFIYRYSRWSSHNLAVRLIHP